ncbi:SIMPL domain-containing protein [Streptomyces sp. V3I7]|uniref:SIMPL domain-containing protein n=1 Tax=Streptomyces sp. V3I7 TaxID=3042278 RepID=UPI002783AB9E|nr:SIMPL domain-containing protein [Streptomyces sp. V3I7]MDQ0990310.1 uncharacterized protein YggE [Streptomyces sp. V3I7]
MTSPSPEPPRVAVRGEAHLEAEPETARITVTVNARGRDRRSALDDLTRRNAAALDLIKSHGDAVERLETGHLTITPELSERGRGERVRTHHGHVQITAVLSDFTLLGELTTRLADLELTRVDGPWWALRPDSPARTQVRRQAVREAVQRAREYAEALGSTLTGLIDIADIGTEHAEPRVRTAPRAPGYGAPAENTPPPALDLEPQRQHLYAQVTARFTMTPPHL